jgi:hypothetical protein
MAHNNPGMCFYARWYLKTLALKSLNNKNEASPDFHPDSLRG